MNVRIAKKVMRIEYANEWSPRKRRHRVGTVLAAGRVDERRFARYWKASEEGRS